MDFLSRLFEGTDGRTLREIREWLGSRGYVRSTLKKEPGVSLNEVHDGPDLSILIWLDRASDWYVELKPRQGGVDWCPVADWARCTGAHIAATIELGPQVRALREHLGRFEAACRPEGLAATVDCLSST